MAELPSHLPVKHSPLSSMSLDTRITEELVVEVLEALVEVNYKWEEIGMALRLPEHIIRQCEDRRNTIALKNILKEWVNGNGLPATAGNLKQTLMNSLVGELHLAQKLFCHTETDSLGVVSIPSHEVEQLKAIYCVQKEVPTDHWPPIGIKTCINLVLIRSDSEINRKYDYSIRGDIDDILQEKEDVEYDDIFGKYTKGQLILVEGRPGSGKTTLVHKIAKDWGTGQKILLKAKLVFLVPLRLLPKKSSHSLYDILEMFYLNKPEFIESIESECGEGLCFILDGLDEYEKSESSVVFSLIHKKYLPHCMVIVTSRPVATAEIRTSAPISKTIEVIGFNSDQIKQYIEKYSFANPCSASELQYFLEAHSNVFHMCYLPIHSAMICFLYNNCGRIPPLETKIYEEFVKLIIIRSAKRHNKSIEVNSLEKIGGKYGDFFCEICKLAFEMISEFKQVIYEKDMEVSIFGGQGDEATLGLITVDKTLTSYNITNTYAFLHLTLQEFLAAYHLSHLDEEVQRKIVKTCRAKSSMSNAIIFYCGMTEFREGDGRLDYCRHTCNFMRCAFESQQSVVCNLALDSFGFKVIDFKLSLRMIKNHISDSDTYLSLRDILERAYVVSNADKKTFSINWNKCSLTGKKLNYFFDNVPNGKLQFLENFCIPFNYLSPKECLGVVQRFPLLHSLVYICLDGNIIDVSVAESLGCVISLKYLHLRKCIIDSNVANTLVKSLRSTKIEMLDVSGNQIGVDREDKWEKLKWLTNLQDLQINGNFVNVLSLVSGLHTYQLGRLSLSYNGCPVSMTVFSKLQDIKAINLSYNIFEDDNTFDLPYSILSEIYLSNCELQEKQSSKLLRALKVCNKLQILDMSCNAIGTHGVHNLCNCLRVWEELETLYIAATNIDEMGAKALAKEINNCKKLKHLDISHNSVQSNGVLAIVNGLGSCRQLKNIGINNICVDETITELVICIMKLRQCTVMKVTIDESGSICRLMDPG